MNLAQLNMKLNSTTMIHVSDLLTADCRYEIKAGCHNKIVTNSRHSRISPTGGADRH